ncbi:DUF697 domain-containing protein [candidate division KSB3 bacterium]|uniref:DUF697 domain-containing protein n=1 Tax=candidate division KSB3 bacterium TaxID=2044937 RepID=A0A9D5JVR9_9BACT|nr:DUF697 domain-containing protein [candidate division KSB3 bacterium]MBD3324817.1 DUF697 domain-containing protein [candidate division KSB3 bacterium]
MQGESETLDAQQPSQEIAKEDLDKIVRHHMWGAMGIGLIPLPIIDIAGLVAVQLNMLRKLADLYGVPFLKDKTRNILSSLLTSVLPTVAAPSLAASITKVFPILGQAAGVITMPVTAGASTYALGKIFIQHFASGGTFLTFDPEKVKAYYADMFKEGQQVAAEMKTAQAPESTAASASPAEPSEATEAAQAEADDLRTIEGIGPKIAQILHENDIRTFAQLAQTEVSHLREILQQAGSQFRMINPESWPEQAQVAARGDWDALEDLQKDLSGGQYKS